MNNYISLGTMSGTSMDGIDLSIINSDGENNTSIVDNFFFEYSSDFKLELINIRKEVLKKDNVSLDFDNYIKTNATQFPSKASTWGKLSFI